MIGVNNLYTSQFFLLFVTDHVLSQKSFTKAARARSFFVY